MLYAKKAIFNAKTMDIKQIQDFCPKFHGSMPTKMTIFHIDNNTTHNLLLG